MGSADEDEANRGTSHFLEHLMFKGTPNRTAREISETMDGIGGNLNAFTEKEQTCFYAKVMDKHVPLAMEMMGDMILHSHFPEEEVEKEKGVILEEIRMYEDAPDELIFDLVAQAAWQNHPLGYPILGTAESVMDSNREKLLHFVKRFYTPNQIIVSVAGRIKHEKIVEMVEKYLSFDTSSNGGKVPIPPAQFSSHRILKRKEIEQVHFCLGMKGFSQKDERRYPLLVLDTILGGNTSSRLFQEIREKRGLAYTVTSFQGAYADSALFGVYGAANPATVQTVIQHLLEILSEIQDKGVTRKELKHAKEHLKGSLSLTLESGSTRMIRLAKSELYYQRFISHKELLDKIQSVTMEDVRDIAKELLRPELGTWAVLGPVTEEIRFG